MRITYRIHAVRRMFERSIGEEDVRQVLVDGEEIAGYRMTSLTRAGCCSGGWEEGRCMWWPPIMPRTMRRSL
jgi:hypothetical protein